MEAQPGLSLPLIWVDSLEDEGLIGGREDQAVVLGIFLPIISYLTCPMLTLRFQVGTSYSLPIASTFSLVVR